MVLDRVSIMKQKGFEKAIYTGVSEGQKEGHQTTNAVDVFHFVNMKWSLCVQRPIIILTLDEREVYVVHTTLRG